MNERNELINCLGTTVDNKFVILDYEPQMLVDIAESEEIKKVRKNGSKMVVGFCDESGKAHETEVVDILIPYRFGLFLAGKL